MPETPKSFEEWHKRTPIFLGDRRKIRARFYRKEGWDACASLSPQAAVGEGELPLEPEECVLFEGMARVYDKRETDRFISALRRQLREAIAQRDEANRDKAFAGEILGKICVYGTLISGERPVDPPPHAAVDAILAQIARAEAAEAKLAAVDVPKPEESIDASGSSFST